MSSILTLGIDYERELMNTDFEFFYESSLQEFDDIFMITEAEDSSGTHQNVIKRLIQSIFNSIHKLLFNLNEALKNAFIKKESLAMDDYLASASGQIRFEHDYKKISETIDGEINKGCKLLQKLNSLSGGLIPEKEIDDWLTNAAKKIENEGPATLEAKATGLVKNFLLNGLKKDKDYVKYAESLGMKLTGNEKADNQRLKIAKGISILTGQKENCVTNFIKTVNSHFKK